MSRTVNDRSAVPSTLQSALVGNGEAYSAVSDNHQINKSPTYNQEQRRILLPPTKQLTTKTSPIEGGDCSPLVCLSQCCFFVCFPCVACTSVKVRKRTHSFFITSQTCLSFNIFRHATRTSKQWSSALASSTSLLVQVNQITYHTHINNLLKFRDHLSDALHRHVCDGRNENAGHRPSETAGNLIFDSTVFKSEI